jgi:hypothetical protein
MQAIPAIKLRIAEHPQLGRDPVVRIAETRRNDACRPPARIAAEADVSGMMMSVTRSLSPRERAALDALLAADFGGAPELRSQAESVLASNAGVLGAVLITAAGGLAPPFVMVTVPVIALGVALTPRISAFPARR